MAKVFHVLTAGIAAALVASIVGCSSSTPTASTPASPSAPGEEVGTTDAGAASNEFRPVQSATLPAPGADPMAVVFSMRQPLTEPIASEQIRVSYPSPEKAVVMVTRNGLPDDSVKASRTRYEFVPAEGSTDSNKLWEITQVGEQNKCQSGRGPEDWSGELCK